MRHEKAIRLGKFFLGMRFDHDMLRDSKAFRGTTQCEMAISFDIHLQEGYGG